MAHSHVYLSSWPPCRRTFILIVCEKKCLIQPISDATCTYLIFGYSKGLIGHKGPSPGLNLQILLSGLHTLLMVFAENLLLHLEYSCFVINIIIPKTFILNIMLLLLGESLATSFFNQSKIKPKPIMKSSHAFSYSWHWLPVIAPSSNWLIVF